MDYSTHANVFESSLDSLCYATIAPMVTPANTMKQQALLDRVEALEHENHDLNIQLHDVETELRRTNEELDQTRAQLHATVSLQEESHRRFMETISQQSNQILRSEERLAEISSSLEKSEHQRKSAESASESKSVRILDLERQVSHLSEELLNFERNTQTTGTRIADLANELVSCQRRLDIQRQRNEQLEQQLLRVHHNVRGHHTSDDSSGVGGMSHLPPEVEPQRQSTTTGGEQFRNSNYARGSEFHDLYSKVYSELIPHGVQSSTQAATSSQGYERDHPVAARESKGVSQREAPSSNTSMATTRSSGDRPMVVTPPVVGIMPSARSEPDYALAQQLETDLLQRCQKRDDAEAKLRKLENQKLRTIADKAKRDALSHELNVLNHEISDIRSQLRGMQQLFK